MVWRASKSSNPSHKFISNKQERYKELTLLFNIHHGKKRTHNANTMLFAPIFAITPSYKATCHLIIILINFIILL